MCNTIFENKPIITFYKDLDNAKRTRLEGLSTRKLQYKEMLLNDEKELKTLNREIED
jgi:hypothetical protein